MKVSEIVAGAVYEGPDPYLKHRLVTAVRHWPQLGKPERDEEGQYYPVMVSWAKVGGSGALGGFCRLTTFARWARRRISS